MLRFGCCWRCRFSTSGITPLAGPELSADFAVSTGLGVALTLFAMQVVGVVVEPWLLLLAPRLGRLRLIRFGLASVGLACFACAASPFISVLLLALAASGPGQGLASELSQAELVDAAPEQTERTLARWTLSGALGDLATPALLAALGFAGLGWRAAFVVSGGLFLLVATSLGSSAGRRGAVSDDDEPSGAKLGFRGALRQPRLVAWAIGVAMCALLDEPLVAFGAVMLHHRFGLELGWRGFALGGWMVGGIVGLLAVEAWLKRRDGTRLLPVFAALAGAATLGFVVAPTPGLAAVALATIGVFGTPLYPLTKARLFQALPGESTTVVAVSAALAPVELVVPLALGAVCDWLGARWAVGLLALQPAYLLVLALSAKRRKLDQ